MKEDQRAIRTLIHEVHINPFGLDWKRFLLAIDQSGEMVGCGQIKIHGDNSRELASIAVKETFRNRGVATKVISELVRQESTRPLYLTCRAMLEPFYEKFGFRTITTKEMPGYFRRVSRIVGLFMRRRDPNKKLLVMKLD